MQFTFELINGLQLGIEHLDVSEMDEDLDYMIILNILVFRFCFIKYAE